MTVAEMKHKRFAREVVKNGGNSTQAYYKIYPKSTRQSAATLGSKLLKNVEVQNEIRSYQQEIAKHIGPEFIAKKLKSLCNAKKGIYYEGEFIANEPDNTSRIAAVRTVLQTQDALSEKTSPVNAVPIVQINLNAINGQQ